MQLSTESVELAQCQAADAEARLREAAALLDTERGGRLEATGQLHALQEQLARVQDSLTKVRRGHLIDHPCRLCKRIELQCLGRAALTKSVHSQRRVDIQRIHGGLLADGGVAAADGAGSRVRVGGACDAATGRAA